MLLRLRNRHPQLLLAGPELTELSESGPMVPALLAQCGKTLSPMVHL